jgi:hypothetical protein
MLKNVPYTSAPQNATEMNSVIAVNFDISPSEPTINFPHAGTWYDYYLHGAQIEVTGTSKKIQLDPGEYKLYTDVEITNPIITSNEEFDIANEISVYPNPSKDVINVTEKSAKELTLFSSQGQKIRPDRLSETTWDARGIASGIYIAEVRTATNKISRVKLIIE